MAEQAAYLDFSKPLEVSDFSGGMTDKYINCPLNQGQLFDNVYILKDNKIFTRPGRTFYVSAAQAQLTTGNQRIAALIKHGENIELFAVSGRYINYVSSSTWTALSGPTSNPALSANATTNYVSWDSWRGHTLLVSDSYADPVKIYRDENSTFQVRTAGMPSIELEGAIDLANSIKSKFNSHIADATEHTSGVDTAHQISASDAYDFDTLVTLITELLTDYAAHEADAALAAAWAYHAAQEATSHALTSTTAPTTLGECLTLLDDLKTKFNAHDADTAAHGTDTLWQVTVTRTPQITSAGGTASYIYAFLYYFSYYVDGVLHEDFGPTYETTYSSAATGTKSISQIPAIANGTTRNYSTSTIKCKIYRSIDGGTTLYYIGQVTNGTTTYSDTTSDATAQTSTVIYTDGDVKDNDPPPRSKFFVAVNDFGVYAGLKIGTKEYPNSFISSIPGDIDSVPGDFQDELEVAITGATSVNIYPILFGRSRMYRLEGIIDEQGRGVIQKREVSRTKGCISNNSIVKIPQGLVWAGEDGFYFSDGFTPPEMISQHLVDTYDDLVASSANEKKIYGEYDSAENRVKWCCKRNSSSSDNDTEFVLDLNFPISARSVFVTHSGQSDCFRPTALAFYNREMVQADARGYVFKYTTSPATDPRVDTTISASSWGTKAIIFDYKGPATDMGTATNFKWVPLISLQFKNDINTSISPQINKNDKGAFEEMKEIRSRTQITWGDPDAPDWNSTTTDYHWNVAKLITAKRRVPRGNLRQMLSQIRITNSYTNIYKSDDFASVTVAAVSGSTTTKTATLLSGTWPNNILDYYITFDTDTYTGDYAILSRDSSSQITFSDPSNEVTVGTKKWLIRGYKKGETIYLLGYTIRWAQIGPIHTTFKGTGGTNA